MVLVVEGQCMGHPPAKVDVTAAKSTTNNPCTSAVDVIPSTSSVDATRRTIAVDAIPSTSSVDAVLGRGPPVYSPVTRPKVSLSMFEKSRFGGPHAAAAKPNLDVQWKPSQIPQTPPIPATSTSPLNPMPSPALRPIIQPASSFFLPPATETTAPTPHRFFSHRLLVWMPYRLWKLRLQCTNPACVGHQLCGGGLHRRVRQVLDIDNYYNMVTETLICPKCRSSYLSWGHTVLQQLDLAHRSEFRVILTRKHACDIRVIRLLHERTLGNGLLTFQEPPAPVEVPSYKWLLTVYSKDILTRLDDIKAAITSTYGSILKMDSTKKITKKLSGPAKGTAQWMTSVGNEIGQVLISVLTADEGGGIDAVAAGLVERYRRASVAPPTLLYVDSHCCEEAGDTKLQQRFSGWPDVIIRLDIWHFMRRLAGGVTTDAHQLYPIFMARLSACIFEWDAGDLTDAEVDKRISKAELALHCRRRTRGTDNTISLLDMLIGELSGPKAKDSMGVPLFDTVRMQHLWRVQKRHVGCIQDPPHVQLYMETGTVAKGGMVLKTFRCARGSTSLESFHCHPARFIPGNSANSLNFQIYLLEGLFRWNKNRAAAALVGGGNSAQRTYTGELVYAVNTSYTALLGRKLVPRFSPPAVHTVAPDAALPPAQLPSSPPLVGSHPPTAQGPPTPVLPVAQPFFGPLLGAQGPSGWVPPAMVSCPLPSRPLPKVHLLLCCMLPSAVLPPAQLPSVQFRPAPVLPPTTQLPSTQGPPVPVLPAAQPPSALPASTGSVPSATAVGGHGIPGLERVDELAEYLVELRTQSNLVLSPQQVATIISLWQNLEQFDKDRVNYAARRQDRLVTGKFRSSKKKAAFTPGVNSTKRCVLGSSGSPAQWPNCSRLVEMTYVRLCNIHRSPKNKGTASLSKWDLVLRDYRKIRQLILSNSEVMQHTTLQLVEVNQRMLITWHNERRKGQEVSALLQGLQLPVARPVTFDTLPPARVQPVTPPQYSHQIHAYKWPPNTAEQVKTKLKNIQASASAISAPMATEPQLPRMLLPKPAPGSQFVLPYPTVLQYRMPITNPVASAPMSPMPPPPAETTKRKYTRTVTTNLCRKCGQFRTGETGHSQYKGKMYCPNTESITKEEWLRRMRQL
ncbi:uncharacterized protein LOC116056487 [Sander lucioperca]|uniref:uncharacterized protein LOC116056487 n=1 Tax=Sander lucioperca TaxID=283035 RepID=UPI00165389F5|nr:uncharacterized protein LOC116056487 [Sander lucioperca]